MCEFIYAPKQQLVWKKKKVSTRLLDFYTQVTFSRVRTICSFECVFFSCVGKQNLKGFFSFVQSVLHPIRFQKALNLGFFFMSSLSIYTYYNLIMLFQLKTSADTFTSKLYCNVSITRFFIYHTDNCYFKNGIHYGLSTLLALYSVPAPSPLQNPAVSSIALRQFEFY